MANRSYLYSTNIIPSSNNKSKEEPKLIGISEWNYAIPIVFQLLVSGKPIACLLWSNKQGHLIRLKD
jgi:hypothetical protein